MKLLLPAMFIAAAGVIGLAKDPGAVLEPRYNPAAPADVRGVVSEIHVVPEGSPLAGVHVTLRTKTEAVEVFLAPAAFLSMLKFKVAVGDDIQAVGSRVSGVILTREFTKKGTTITLRDPDGTPVWMNWGVAADATSAVVD
jgi:hypothetical protein